LCVCQNGHTALITASRYGHTETAKLLVDAKANTDIQTKVTLAEERAESLRAGSRSFQDPIPGRFWRIGVE
jgi:ankyrin repeat protein